MSRDKVMQSMIGNRIKNYIIPGLNSYMLECGKVRMFESTREYAGTVTPHSHRFDFACYVLQGEVINRVYSPVSPFGDGSTKKLDGDVFTERRLTIDNDENMGEYSQMDKDSIANYTSESIRYVEGDWYSMDYEQIHSIMFGKDSRVLFFEGPEKVQHNTVLLPRIHNETLETMECDKPWMYVQG